MTTIGDLVCGGGGPNGLRTLSKSTRGSDPFIYLCTTVSINVATSVVTVKVLNQVEVMKQVVTSFTSLTLRTSKSVLIIWIFHSFYNIKINLIDCRFIL